MKQQFLEDKLEAYSEIVHASLGANHKTKIATLDSLLVIFPENIRLSIINKQGVVLFDNKIDDLDELENHRQRVEIIQALESGQGRNIRTSVSNQEPYLYFAKNYYDYYIRVALPYNEQTKSLLQSDHVFLSFILLFFGVSLILLYALTNRFGKSIIVGIGNRGFTAPTFFGCDQNNSKRRSGAINGGRCGIF